MTDMRHMIILPLCGLLAACGGGGAAPGDAVSAPGEEAAIPPSEPGPDVRTVSLEPRVLGKIVAAQNYPVGFTPPTPTYDPQADTFLSRGETLRRVDDALLPAGFVAYNDGTSAVRGVRAETADARVFAVRHDGVGHFMRMERLGNTDMPTAGRGTFTGSYAGTLGTGNAENRGTIVGNVTLDVDFGTRDLSGSIDKRINQNGREFAVLTLGRGELGDDGRFDALVAGGPSPSLGFTASVGSLMGLVVGEAADGLVGSAFVQHSGSPTFVDLYEAGAFVAERQ
jgi:hypothetical protein